MPLSTIRRSLLPATLIAITAIVVAPIANAAATSRTEARVGMSEAEFKAANAGFFAQGMRLMDITVAEVQGRPVIGASWWWSEGMAAGSAERARQLQDRTFLKQSEKDVRALAQKFNADPEIIDSYSADGKTWSAVAFPPGGEPPMQPVGPFLTEEQVGGMRDEARANGFELARMETYMDAGSPRFLPVFYRRSPAEIDFVEESNPIALKARSAQWLMLDKTPLSISLSESKPGDRSSLVYFATAEPGAGRQLLVSLSPEDFRKDVAPRLAAGARVLDMDSYAFPDGVSYSLVLIEGQTKVDTSSYKTMGDGLEKIINKK